MKEFKLKSITKCSPANCCVSCKESKKFQLGQNYVTMLKKLIDHDCMSNWDGSARSMEGEGGRLLIIELNENDACYVLLLVKDDDGTITASASPRQFTKKEKLEQTFSPEIRCLKNENENVLPPNTLPFIAAETFVNEKKGYLFYHDNSLGHGYHFDTYPKIPQFELTKVPSIAESRQNDRSKFYPEYEYLRIGELADPQHRCRNFGKEIVVLAKAPLRDCLFTDKIAARIIKAFKYW